MCEHTSQHKVSSSFSSFILKLFFKVLLAHLELITSLYGGKPQDLPVTAPLVLGWHKSMLGIQLRSAHLHSKYYTYWAISPAPKEKVYQL